LVVIRNYYIYIYIERERERERERNVALYENEYDVIDYLSNIDFVNTF